MGILPPKNLTDEQVDKQLKWIEKQTFVHDRSQVCVLITNKDKVREAFDKMNKNNFKTVK
jgi:hypothetical protein